MKLLLFPLLLLFSCYSNAQDYACLNSGVKRYFINSNNYLRGLRVDSVKTLTDTTAYYLFHTVRGNYFGSGLSTPLDSTGGSWLGFRVLQLSDGTFIFDNYSGHPVTIKTQSGLGDSWIFQQDISASVYYRASLISIDTTHVLGELDTVKYIKINAYSGSVLVPTDPLNGYEVAISKNHGFQSVFDLYDFPYPIPDYYHDICGAQFFKPIYFTSPTQMELYNWHVNDVYAYGLCFFNSTPPGMNCNPATEYDVDTVYHLGGTATHTTYNFGGPKSVYGWTGPMEGHYNTYIYSDSITCDTTLVVDTVRMPEEFRQSKLYSYYPDDSSYCMKSPRYASSPNNIEVATYFAPFEHSGPNIVSKLWLGVVHSWSTSFPETESKQLVYYNRGGYTCGSPISLAVPEVQGHNTIKISPNPAANELTISCPDIITEATLTDVVGHILYSGVPNSKNIHLNVSNYPPGLYIVRVNNMFLQKFIKE